MNNSLTSPVWVYLNRNMQEWETETMDIDFGGVVGLDDLGLDLAGGRDDPICPGENPVYVSSINKVNGCLNH